MKIRIKDKVYEVEISDSGGERVKIKVGGKEFSFGEDKKEISVAKTVLPKRDFSKKEIKAPIAGIVSEIFVKEEDFIKKEQKTLVISAMKMENEIVSDFEGRIRKILVQKNQEVKEGDTLIVFQ